MFISYLLEKTIVSNDMSYVLAELLGWLPRSHRVLSIGGGSSSQSGKTIIAEAKGVKINVGLILSSF